MTDDLKPGDEVLAELVRFLGHPFVRDLSVGAENVAYTFDHELWERKNQIIRLLVEERQAIRALIAAADALAHDILTPEGYCYCGGNVFEGGHHEGCRLDDALEALSHPAIKRLAEEEK